MIGMDHFALPGDELALALEHRTLHRNFMGYTTLHGLAEIALGVSAISDFGDSYWQNPKELDDYLEQASDPKPQRGIKLDEDDMLRRQVIEGLMCHGEIRFDEFGGKGLIFRITSRIPEKPSKALRQTDWSVSVRIASSLPTADVFSCAIWRCLLTAISNPRLLPGFQEPSEGRNSQEKIGDEITLGSHSLKSTGSCLGLFFCQT